jgi:hypothetical protein
MPEFAPWEVRPRGEGATWAAGDRVGGSVGRWRLLACRDPPLAIVGLFVVGLGLSIPFPLVIDAASCCPGQA